MDATAASERSQNGAGSATLDASRSESFLRPHLLSLAPYTPIEPFEVLSQRLGREPGDIIKLDANENPYGPPPEVLQALGSLEFPNIYPDPESRALRDALADSVGVPAENLLVRPFTVCRIMRHPGHLPNNARPSSRRRPYMVYCMPDVRWSAAICRRRAKHVRMSCGCRWAVAPTS